MVMNVVEETKHTTRVMFPGDEWKVELPLKNLVKIKKELERKPDKKLAIINKLCAEIQKRMRKITNIKLSDGAIFENDYEQIRKAILVYLALKININEIYDEVDCDYVYIDGEQIVDKPDKKQDNDEEEDENEPEVV